MVASHQSPQCPELASGGCTPVLPFPMESGLSEGTDEGRVAHTAASLLCLLPLHMARFEEKRFCVMKRYEHAL